MTVLGLPPGSGSRALDVQPLSLRRVGQMAAPVGHTLVGVIENLGCANCAHCGERQALWGAGDCDLRRACRARTRGPVRARRRRRERR